MVRSLIPLVGMTVLYPAVCLAQSRGSDPLKPLFSERLQADLELTPKQKQRLYELQLQWEGPKALRREDVAKKVGLRSDQRDAIEEIYETHTKLEFEYFKLRRVDRDKAGEVYKKLRESEKTLDQRVLQVLSEFQVKMFARVLGEPFDRSKLYEPLKSKPDV